MSGLIDRILSWFENRIDPFPPQEPEQAPQGLLAFCWHYSKDIWPILAIVSFLGASVAMLEVTLFSYLGSIVDWLSTADRATFLEQEKGTLIMMGLVTLVLLPVVHVLWSLVFHQTIMGNYPMRIRWQAHRYLLGQSMHFYQDEFAGRVATKVMQTALGVREAVTKVLDIFIYVIVYFISAAVLVASFDLLLLMPFIVWVVLYGFVMRYFLPRMAEVSKRQADARSMMTGRVVDSYTNIGTVKLFAHAGRETSYARESMDDFLKTVHPQMRLSTGMNMSLDFLNNLLLFSVGAIAIWQWLDGSATVAAVAVAAAVVTRLSGMSHWVLWEMAGLFESIGMAIDGMNTIAQPRSVLDKPDAKALTVKKGEVAFDEVSFEYDRHGRIIRDMNLTIAPGEKIGLIGRSGAGKSTLMNIMLRLYDIKGGTVQIDGQDITGVTQESLRAQIAVVTQDTSLLHRSVRENISYGRPDATDEQVEAAARKANAHEFIMELRDNDGRTGYDAQVGERGVKLSGGQRQRVAIARVFLKDAPILILDEATSALDSEVEAIIQEKLFELMEGKTVLAIAHRLSTIADMDRLIVLDGGQIVEQGTHDELVKQKGLYASLWSRQSGGFIDTESIETTK
ncbi:ABC transporter ATP-binding protein [Ahrensia sp. R2A130]|uniref:ABC transporter ATP-binding protein n=1 Tax=Ahrensia sp. R2A130 TaxID=744979 RepID=UPI0001E08403|nr:ABC transporter ATP-binding protein [Ahrensia sp. R2A130]EFL89057.1 multidrug resistance ABC transporter ATP-binding and permease protein [Ahrensia sp. R2A130]